MARATAPTSLPEYDPTHDPEVLAVKQKYARIIRQALFGLLGFGFLLALATLFLLRQAR